MAGIFNFDDVPKPATIDLDPETKDLISNAVNRSNQSAESIANESYNPAAQLGQQQFGSDAESMLSERQRGGLMDPNLVSAIRAKQGTILGQNMGKLRYENSLNAFNQRAERLNFAHNALIAQRRVETDNYHRLLSATNNENEIRAGLLKGWMSLAGAGVGGYLGGPAGAMVGSQVGGPPSKPEQLGQPSYSSGNTGVTQNDYLGDYGSGSGSGRYGYGG